MDSRVRCRIRVDWWGNLSGQLLDRLHGSDVRVGRDPLDSVGEMTESDMPASRPSDRKQVR